jgi:hypothetical protein
MAVSRKTAEAAKSTVKTDVAGRRVAKKGEPIHAVYTEKAIPPVIQDFVEYIKETTGYDVDPRAVYMASALRGPFQKSEGNQKRMADRKAEIEREAAEREERRAARAEAKAAREAGRAEKAAAKAAEPKAEKAPAKTTTKAAATKAPATKAAPARAAATKTAATAKATPATGRRRPARPTAKGADADF